VSNLQRTIEKLQAQTLAWHERTAATQPFGQAAPASGFKLHPHFGTNPGALKMLSHVPSGMAKQRSLVVVLHGCTQEAAAYANGTGWKSLADKHGFALLLPAQAAANNQNGCFNWFQPSDTQRGQGEALSIFEMIETMIAEERIDRDRIFITGLSAGGAMTSAMLACYPEVFAAGAIIAGLPFGVAGNVQRAFDCMFRGSGKSAEALAALVREAAPASSKKWPRISIWHGEADQTVVPANGREIAAQWTVLHGLPQQATRTGTVSGARHEVWLNPAGEQVVEAYSIPGMGHGTPVSPGTGPDECGEAGPFILDAGIASSLHIARFFGLTGIAAAANADLATSKPAAGMRLPAVASRPAKERAAAPEAPRGKSIQTIIDQALKAAGLIKS
jgi:poly(hydroxyalkanoate) depolymerase family esterase